MTESGETGGIFGTLIEPMIESACGLCKNGHGQTVVHLLTNGKGKLAHKAGPNDVISDMDDVTQISFPVNGLMDDTRYLKEYAFLPIVESPGVAFLTLADKQPPENVALTAVLNCWPLVVLSFALAYIAGFIVWCLDSPFNPGHFPPSYPKGTWEGFWWSFVSMTTVGYGDRAPVGLPGKIFSILWILCGLLLVSVATSFLTMSLTTITMTTNVMLYGTKVAALQNSSEYRTGVLKNARVESFESLDGAYEALVSGQVKGLLVDTYVAGSTKGVFGQTTLRVSKIIHKSMGYGVVLSGTAARLRHTCQQYLNKHSAYISKLIESSVTPLEQPAYSEAEQRSSGLFDSSSQIYKDILVALMSVLGATVLSGLVWQAALLSRRWRRVASKNVEGITDEAKLRKKAMELQVETFYSNFARKITDLRESHRRESLLYHKMKKNKM